jgi:hypothetical protein
MWNSVLSTKGAKYMCLNIKNFYLTAPLDQYEYMKMPLSLRILKCDELSGAFPRQASWQTRYSENVSSPMVTTSVNIPRAYGDILPAPSPSR